MNSFNQSIDLLQRGLDVASLRYQVTADNIANAGTPGFKRSHVNFESELKRAFESEERAKNAFELTKTDSRHISINTVYDWHDVEPRRVKDYLVSDKASENGINVETEAMNAVKINMQYRLLSQLESFEFAQMKTAMSSNRG